MAPIKNTYSSAHQPEFISEFFICTMALSHSGMQLRCWQETQKPMNVFHQMNEINFAEFQVT